jgi:hypothetical protein
MGAGQVLGRHHCAAPLKVKMSVRIIRIPAL